MRHEQSQGVPWKVSVGLPAELNVTSISSAFAPAAKDQPITLSLFAMWAMAQNFSAHCACDTIKINPIIKIAMLSENKCMICLLSISRIKLKFNDFSFKVFVSDKHLSDVTRT